MSISSSKEFLINMKPGDIPPWHKGKHFYEQPYSTIEFFLNEMDKIRNGLTIDGVFIHPWLYFHLNVFKTPIPQPDKSEPNIHPPLRDNEWYMAENYKLAQDSNKGIIMFGSRRFSKALKDDELLFYVDGNQRPIGNAKVGDYIFGGDGKPTKITGVYPQGKVQLYKVTLDDGREVKCCADHLWEVFDLQAGIMKTLPLKEIIKRYKYERKAHGKSTHVYNYYIPISEAIEYPYTELPVDPYILGVWLGDGHSKTSAITNIDDEIKSLFSAYAETLGLHIREEGITMFATSGPSTRINPFKSKLLALNVINNKHIPEVYFRASKEQRLELLRGIMDSDGTISRGGHAISFSQKKERLASDVLRLCHELGIRAHKEFETGGYTLKDGSMNTFFRVNLFPRINPFKLKRKANRFRETVVRHEKTRRDRVPIINIEVAEVDNATCIRVDNKDSLFLTTNCVVTHNSVQESSILMWNSLTRENITNDVTCGTSGDLSNITKFLQIAHADMHPAFRLPTIRSQWDKLVQFGFKEAGTELNRFYSEIRLVNAEDGLDKKSEKGAGGAPGCVILDEIGKFNFLPYYLGLLPALKTPYGLKAVVLLSGCVCAGTKVWNNKGELVNIEDLKPEEGILGFNEKTGESSQETITYWQPPHKKQCYRITTNKNRVLECSFDHPILKRDRYSSGSFKLTNTFTAAEEINVGDHIAIIDEINVRGTEVLYEPRLTGWLVGDGSYGQSNTWLMNADEEMLKYVEEKFHTKTWYEAETKDGRVLKKMVVKGLYDHLKKIGIANQTKDKKRLPKNIEKYRDEDIFEFLGGYFDADGCSYINEKTGESFIKLTSSNKVILEETRLLLQKYGIHANILYEKPNFNNPKTTRGHYNLIIKDKNSYLNFYKNIKFSIKYKQDRLEKGVKSKIVKGSLKLKPNNGVVYEKVKSVEEIGLRDVYNLTAGNTNTYIANGIITHNTGGNADLSKDAEKVLNNPEAYSLLPMNWDILENKITDPAQITWKRKLFGMYIPPQMAYEEGLIKNEKTIAEYLRVPPSKSLNEIKIQVTDWENSNKVLLNLRKQYENDKFALDKERMYHPMNIDECFLKGESNPFPANIAKEHRVKLEASGDIGKPVELRRTENNWFTYTINNELKRAKYPHDPGPINSPFILYDELPTSKPAYGEFVSGLDPYKSEESTTNSVASLYVIQRRSPMVPIELIKMSYAARPNKFGTLHRNLHMGIEVWNAECLMENADPGFFQYTEAKHITRQLLAEGVDWAKMVNPKANPRTSIGFAPSPKNIEYLVSLTIDYCWEEIEIGKNEDGTPIIKYGVEFIPDIELLREIEDYGKGTNFDRIRSFGAALAWARWLDKLRVVPKTKVVETKSRDELRDKLRKANKGFLPAKIKK